MADALLKRQARPKPALRLIQGEAALARREPTDEELIEALRSGDQRVAGLLYDRLVGNVEKALYRVFGQREPEHDDLVQTAFEQIVLTLQRKSYAQACSLKTWASSIASHIALNTLRSRRCERKVLDRSARIHDDLHPRAVDGEGRVSARLELERMRRELAHLPMEQAETVLMHDVLGHDMAEIAVILQASVMATQTRLFRGRRELLRRMGVERPPTRKRRAVGVKTEA
ncbi:MAG: RNA polymerase sigma factor [Myxococcota bacterium]|nr:RNA polymerase sigma factor [Myxococcota bacterium]